MSPAVVNILLRVHVRVVPRQSTEAMCISVSSYLLSAQPASPEHLGEPLSQPARVQGEEGEALKVWWVMGNGGGGW
jgi:hypothetical protein